MAGLMHASTLPFRGRCLHRCRAALPESVWAKLSMDVWFRQVGKEQSTSLVLAYTVLECWSFGVGFHRYICLRGHLSGSLENACNHTLSVYIYRIYNIEVMRNLFQLLKINAGIK